jgi:GDP-D-mannose 3',5'-epimerase
MSEMSKTLVTGGAGFIGSHLARRLLDESREVILTDDFSRGSIANLSDLSIQIPCANIDLRDYSQVLKLMKGVDTVFHLAARVGSVKYLHGSDIDELTALQTNLAIDVNVFKACLEKDVKNLIYTSSVSVYPIDRQNARNVILSEDDIHYMNPEGGYGWAKLIAEIQLTWMKGINIAIGRIFNIYGENSPLGESAHVIAALIHKAILYPKEEFRVWGNGEQTRDLLYVGDCVEALLKLEKKASNPPIIINIGSGEAVSIKVIAEKIAQLSGKNPEVIYDPTKPVGPLSRTADVSKAKAMLGWQPKTSLNNGLERTYSWFEKRLRGN